MGDFLQGMGGNNGAMSMSQLANFLQMHRNIPFVKRILDPNAYPKQSNPDGSYSTHLMSYAGPNENGEYMVYPNITYGGNKLTRRDGRDAVDYALKNLNYLIFPERSEAEWFSKNYKKVWKDK